MNIVSGMDFGTTNSAVSYFDENTAKMVDLEKGNITIPTTMFFTANNKILYGNDAIETFLRHENGRFIRSIKSILGTSLMGEGTRINNKLTDFSDIIGYFVTYLKSKLDAQVGISVDNIVIGRPVKFNESDKTLDTKAQQMLGDIARNSGFKFVEFQYEPVAAAFAHEQRIIGEKLAMVIDIGGGTSDFSVIRIGDKLRNKLDRSDDILSNAGAKVGGNTFDKDLSFNGFMSLLGKDTTIGEKNLPMPNHVYSELSDWNELNFIYAPKNMRMIREIYQEANDKEKVGRMMSLVNGQRAHEFLQIVEKAKIDLTSVEQIESVILPLRDKPSVITTRSKFDEYAVSTYERIQKSLGECLTQAGKKGTDIDIVVLTGGSTEIVKIKKMVRDGFPNAMISDEGKMTSVGEGLAFAAQRRFSR